MRIPASPSQACYGGCSIHRHEHWFIFFTIHPGLADLWHTYLLPASTLEPCSCPLRLSPPGKVLPWRSVALNLPCLKQEFHERRHGAQECQTFRRRVAACHRDRAAHCPHLLPVELHALQWAGPLQRYMQSARGVADAAMSDEDLPDGAGRAGQAQPLGQQVLIAVEIVQDCLGTRRTL